MLCPSTLCNTVPSHFVQHNTGLRTTTRSQHTHLKIAIGCCEHCYTDPRAEHKRTRKVHKEAATRAHCAKLGDVHCRDATELVHSSMYQMCVKWKKKIIFFCFPLHRVFKQLQISYLCSISFAFDDTWEPCDS